MKRLTLLTVATLCLCSTATTQALASDTATANEAVGTVQRCVYQAFYKWWGGGQLSAQGGESPWTTFEKCRTADERGDPHITTFRGITYDHNFPGVYRMLTVANETVPFTLTTRNEIDEVNQVSAYTIVTAAQVILGTHRIEVYRSQDKAILDDAPVKPSAFKKIVLKDDQGKQIGYLSRQPGSWFVANTVDDVALAIRDYDHYLDIAAIAPDAPKHDIGGLMGNPEDLRLIGQDGTPLPDGDQIERTLFTDLLESWRVEEGNLFSDGTLDPIPDYSARIYTIADLEAGVLEKIAPVCTAMQQEAKYFDSARCQFDLGFGGYRMLRSNRYHLPATLRLRILN